MILLFLSAVVLKPNTPAVLQGSEYLDKWFEHGIVTQIQLKNIPSEFISFTYGDSASTFRRNGKIHMITKEMLSESLRNYRGTVDDYMKEITEKCFYIEVQLWNDDYLKWGRVLQLRGGIISEMQKGKDD